MNKDNFRTPPKLSKNNEPPIIQRKAKKEFIHLTPIQIPRPLVIPELKAKERLLREPMSPIKIDLNDKIPPVAPFKNRYPKKLQKYIN